MTPTELSRATNPASMTRMRCITQAVERSKPLLHTWSLAVEEQFYLLFPLLLLLFRKAGQRVLLLLTGGLVGAGVAGFAMSLLRRAGQKAQEEVVDEMRRRLDFAEREVVEQRRRADALVEDRSRLAIREAQVEPLPGEGAVLKSELGLVRARA